MNKMIWLVLICGIMSSAFSANVSMNLTVTQGLGELVAIDYAISSDVNIEECTAYNSHASLQDPQYYWSMIQSGTDISGKAVFKKDDQNPVTFRCRFSDSSYQSRDVVVTPLRIIDGMQLLIILIALFICLFLCYTRVEIIWGVGAGALMLLYSKLCEFSLIDSIPTYAMMNFVLKICLGLVFVLLLFRFLNDDLTALMKGPGKRVGEQSDE